MYSGKINISLNVPRSVDDSVFWIQYNFHRDQQLVSGGSTSAGLLHTPSDCVKSIYEIQKKAVRSQQCPISSLEINILATAQEGGFVAINDHDAQGIFVPSYIPQITAIMLQTEMNQKFRARDKLSVTIQYSDEQTNRQNGFVQKRVEPIQIYSTSELFGLLLSRNAAHNHF